MVAEAERQLEEGLLDETARHHLLPFYRSQVERAKEAAGAHSAEADRRERLVEAARSLALLEREAIEHQIGKGTMSDAVAAELLGDAHARRDALDAASHEGDEALRMAFEKLYPGGKAR